MSTILKVDDINVYYGSIHAIKGISFEVNEGEIVTLIGANGAGKSTTLNTISGLLHSKTGHIEFMGEPLNHVPSHRVVSTGAELHGRRMGRPRGTADLPPDVCAGKSGHGCFLPPGRQHRRRYGAGL